MSFKHIRNTHSGHEYDAPVSAIERWPEEYTVVDDTPVDSPRPAHYFEQLAAEPPKKAKKGDWEAHAQKLGIDTAGLTVPQIRDAIDATKTAPAPPVTPDDAATEQ